MTRTIRVAWTAAACAVVVSGSVAARQDGTVSGEVIAILFEGLDGAPGGFELRVGDAALDFPRDLLPAGAAIAVSAIGDRTTTIVATAPLFVTADRAGYEQRLAAAGWMNPQRPTGFVPSVVGPVVSVCRGSEFATVAFSPRPTGGTYVRASLMRDPRRACVAGPSTAHAEMPLPSLTAPDGAVAGRASLGGSSDVVYSSVRIRTALAVETVGSHYADQLTAAGWRVEGRTADQGAMSVIRLRATSAAGEPVTGLLIVTAIEGTGDLDVMLRVVQHADGRR